MTAPGKVRIAVATEYPLLQYGGTEALVRQLILGLARHFEIVLVSGDKNREALGDPFASLVTAHLSWDKAAASRETAKKLARALVDQNIALAHFHSGGTYDWQSHKAWQSPIFHFSRTGMPFFVTSHLVPPLLEGFTRPDRPSWQRALLLPKAWMSKASIMSRVQREFLVSKHDEAQLRRFYPPFASKLGQIYHSTLALPHEETFSKSREKTVFCLGTFGERKGQTILVRAFSSIARRHPEWTLVMMGRGDVRGYLAEVKEIATRSGIGHQVVFPSPQGDPVPFLKSTSIFAMPSLSEGLGLSLQEALYYECPCVGSAVGGIPELIEDGETGLLVPPGDANALAAALDRLMSDLELRTRLGGRGRQSIIEKGMLADIMVENYVQIYETMLAGGRAS